MAEFDFVNQFPHNHSVGDIDEVLVDVVDELNAQRDSLATSVRLTFQGHPVPSRSEIARVVDLLRSVIFPGYFGNRDVTEASLGYHMGTTLHRVSLMMVDEVHRGLCFACSRDTVDRTPDGLPDPRQTHHGRGSQDGYPRSDGRLLSTRSRRTRATRRHPVRPRRSSVIPGSWH